MAKQKPATRQPITARVKTLEGRVLRVEDRVDDLAREVGTLQRIADHSRPRESDDQDTP